MIANRGKLRPAEPISGTASTQNLVRDDQIRNDDLLNIISRRTYMGMPMRTKSKVKQQCGLFFKDGELILSKRFPNNRRLLHEVYVAAREYARQFQQHKRD